MFFMRIFFWLILLSAGILLAWIRNYRTLPGDVRAEIAPLSEHAMNGLLYIAPFGLILISLIGFAVMNVFERRRVAEEQQRNRPSILNDEDTVTMSDWAQRINFSQLQTDTHKAAPSKTRPPGSFGKLRR
jgi:hypothetical protein